MKRNVILFALIFSNMVLFAQVPELKINNGHSNDVNSVCFSPDDKYIASGSEDKTIKLWDVATGKELKTFTDADKVYSVTFSSDGKHLISGGGAGVKMWEILSGNVTQISGSSTHFAEISNDGKLVYANDDYGKIVLKSMQNQEKKKVLLGHIGYGYCAKFSPDGKYFVSGNDDKTIKIWNVEKGTAIKTLKGHKEGVNSINYSADGRYIVSGGGVNDRTVRIWDAATGNILKVLSGHTNAVTAVCFSPDGKYVVSGSYDGTVKFWDVLTGANIKTYQEHFLENILTLNLSHDGKYLVTGNGNKTIRIIDVNANKDLVLLPGDKTNLEQGFFYPDGNSVINTSEDLTANNAGSTNLTVKIWDWSGSEKVSAFQSIKKLLKDVNDASGSLKILGFSRDFKNVISCYSIGAKSIINIYDLKTGECKKTLNYSGSIYSINIAAFSTDSKILAIGDNNGTVEVWNIEREMVLKSTFKSFKNGLEAISVSPDGKLIVTGGDEGNGSNSLKVWNANDGKKIFTMTGHVNGINSVCFSPDGKFIVSGSCDGNIKVWNVLTGKEVKNIGSTRSMVSSVNFSSDGKYLVSGHYFEENTVKVWDFTTGEELKSFQGHTGKVKSAQFSSDGKNIVSTSDDGSVKIWDVATGKCKVTRYDVPNSNDWIAVTPDGRFDGTDGGMKLLYYVKDLEVIPLESFYEKFYTPGLVAQIMNNAESNSNQYTISKDVKLPPKVKIISPTSNDKFNTEEIEVVIEATDQGGGVDEIRLYQNGKLVNEELRGMKPISQVGEKYIKRYKIFLLSGNNELKAIAFNSDRTESIPFVVKIEMINAITTSNLYVVSIGINKYKNEKYNLTYSCSDANGFVQAVKLGSEKIFKNIKTLVLENEQCNKETILSCLNDLSQKVKPEDVLIFYYAGHGVMSEGSKDKPSEFYFVPFDVTQLYGNDELLSLKGISASELKMVLVKMKAQKQLIVMDACQSGGATEVLAMRGAAEEKAMMQLARSTGIAVLASTGTEQFSSELKQLGHGIFTYSLIEGLSGKADGGNKDGKITIKELAAYLEDSVPELTKKYRGTVQYPNASIRGMDFPIVIYK